MPGAQVDIWTLVSIAPAAVPVPVKPAAAVPVAGPPVPYHVEEEARPDKPGVRTARAGSWWRTSVDI